MRRRGHALPVHLRGCEHGGENAPPQPPGGVRDPDQHLRSSTGSDRIECCADSAPLGHADALQKRFGAAPATGRREAVQWLSSGAVAGRTGDVPGPQRCTGARERSEQPPRVGRCGPADLRLRVETLVEENLL